MPIISKTDPKYKDTDGAEKEAFVFTFTNGAKDQLIELKGYFAQPNELEVIKLAISFLQRLKEQQEKMKNTVPSVPPKQ